MKFELTREEALAHWDRGEPQEILRRILELRNASDAAECDFLLAVHVFDVSELWRALSPGTFDQALRRLHICAPERFSRWRRAMRDLGEEVVREIGVAGAVQAVRLESIEDRRTAIEVMLATVQKEGAVISDQTARSIVSRLMPRFQVLERSKTMAVLKRENDVLRKKVAELEAENAKLKAENARLAKTLAKSERSSASRADRSGNAQKRRGGSPLHGTSRKAPRKSRESRSS